jgi:hypothetical protein
VKDTLRTCLADDVDVLDQLDAVIEAGRSRLAGPVLAPALADLDAFAARMRQALAGALADGRAGSQDLDAPGAVLSDPEPCFVEMLDLSPDETGRFG